MFVLYISLDENWRNVCSVQINVFGKAMNDDAYAIHVVVIKCVRFSSCHKLGAWKEGFSLLNSRCIVSC